MIRKHNFSKSSIEVAIDLGLKTLRFSKSGELYIPETCKEILITDIVAYGTQRGYEPERTKSGKIIKSREKGLESAGTIDMYWMRIGYNFVISTDEEGRYSTIAINGGIPVSGFSKDTNHLDLFNTPTKFTKNLGIDQNMAKTLDGMKIFDNPYVEIRNNKIDGTYKMDVKQKSKDYLCRFKFTPKD
jgi:3-methyladenine DNA glycosylase Mpg